MQVGAAPGALILGAFFVARDDLLSVPAGHRMQFGMGKREVGGVSWTMSVSISSDGQRPHCLKVAEADAQGQRAAVRCSAHLATCSESFMKHHIAVRDTPVK